MEIRIDAEIHIHLHDEEHHRPSWVDDILEAISMLADSEEDKQKMRALGKDVAARTAALAEAAASIPPTTP